MRTAFFVSSILLILTCTAGSSQPDHLLDVNSFEKKLKNTPDRILLDVRTEAEYSKGHFPNVILIDIRKSTFKGEVSKLNKSTPVFVYCASGIRSEKAVEIMKALGFQEIYELEGGFHEWVAAGKPFVED
ncbi:MAG: rhodanese-like domain-containing protein [Cyclobacteriaceae bacterium]